ncbi:MAG TPA: DUF1572 family protein [Candidatus Dormibacteraeota bacterium]|nr:DUF1572 family protein [Candidatus Dormibacteraeota bacterium]
MATKRFDPGREFLNAAQHSLKKSYLPKIVKCLNALSEQDTWWRPNEASNSAGNLMLHLSGNVQQFITSRIGGSPDVRERDKEFSELGPLPRAGLVALLRSTVDEACRVLANMPGDSLGEPFDAPGPRITRLRAIANVLEHFSYHAGQIAYIAKLKTARDLKLFRLPQPKATEPAKPDRRKKNSTRAR